ncbi:hypothetical protein QYE76_047610 [Lolium multiflorum]|uniref:Uncharacterized protein n=1 Tax=Lolium multiflorum TaxID=4521 RepID=A0AAD8WZG5_LOLMU|nr:hypothetical protein QYE76_047610 [Lolium multiflorum]
MGKKKISTLATSDASSGAAARSSPNPPKRSASYAPPLAPAPPAPSSSVAGSIPGDWPSTTTKRDEKKAKSLGYIPSEEGNVILPDPDYLQDLPNDTSERGDSSVPVGSHTEENASSEAEHADPMNPEAILIDPKSAANDISDTAGSMHDDDADHAAFVDAAAEEAEALPSKRSSGGFADEDDLWDLGEDFIEPPPKKYKIGVAPSNLAASEASAPATIPAAQISTASSLSKGKNIPPASAAAVPPSGKPDLQVVISSVESFTSQYASLEVDKAQLQKEVESSSTKLEGAIKIAAEAHAEIDALKGELGELKRRLKDEETARLTAEARAMEKDDLLRQSSLALLNNHLFVCFSIIVFANIDSFVNAFLHTLSFSGAADIPAEALDEVPNNSPSNTLAMTLASHQLVQDLLQKGKGAMARIHLMIFPKISQDKTLGQLFDAFAVNTKEVIEVLEGSRKVRKKSPWKVESRRDSTLHGQPTLKGGVQVDSTIGVTYPRWESHLARVGIRF